MTFVAMQFDPPVKWMTEKDVLSLPMVGDFRSQQHQVFVDYNEESDVWWHGETMNSGKIKWHRVILIREPEDE